MKSDNRKWVLVVEDDELLQRAICIVLKTAGFTVLCCSRSTEALRILANQKFDCVLLDMHLESGTGEQVISSLHAYKEGFNHKTPILVISGGLDADLVKRIGGRVAGVLVKPFDTQGFLSRIWALCAREGGTNVGKYVRAAQQSLNYFASVRSGLANVQQDRLSE